MDCPDVVYAAREAYPCSKDGQERLRKAITEQELERVLIAGCSPRLVEKLFRQAVHPSWMPAILNVANIREQVAYVHPGDKPGASRKPPSLSRWGLRAWRHLRCAAPHRAGGQVRPGHWLWV